MSKIKIIETGKCKLLAVMVPEGATKHLYIPKINTVAFFNEDSKGRVVTESVKFTFLSEGNWQLLGLSTELTEEQWRDVVEETTFGNNIIPIFRNYNRPLPQWTFACATAKESGLSLLEANQIYSVNPYDAPVSFIPQKHEEAYKKWSEAESNTGRWLILKQL